MWKGMILVCAALFLLAGCAEVPRPSTYSNDFQKHVQSATHWQNQARVTVERLKTNPQLPDILQSYYKGRSPGVYVQTSDQTPFDKAFRKYLITELVNNGYTISESLDSPVRIYWDFQLVDRNKKRWLPRPGPVEFAAETVVWFFTSLRWNTTDFYAPKTELILTTRFTVGDDKPQNIVANGVYSDTFYINKDDWVNYANLYQTSPRSVAAKDEAWKQKLGKEGLLAPTPPAKKIRE